MVYCRKARTDAAFRVDDLPGSGGRMDVAARCVQTALWLSNDIRRDTKIYIVLNGPPRPPVTICFDGATLRNVSPDERSIALWIKKYLQHDATKEWAEINPGISVSKSSFQDVVTAISKDHKLFVLHENGADAAPATRDNVAFILGDHIGLPENDEKYCMRFGAEKMSVGPKSYLASHCMIIANNALDRFEARRDCEATL